MFVGYFVIIVENVFVYIFEVVLVNDYFCVEVVGGCVEFFDVVLC